VVHYATVDDDAYGRSVRCYCGKVSRRWGISIRTTTCLNCLRVLKADVKEAEKEARRKKS